MLHSATDTVIESGFTSQQFYIQFLASTRAAVMDSSLHCFLLQLGVAFGAAVAAGLALALCPPVFNFFLGIIPIIHVHIFKMIYNYLLYMYLV